MNRRFSALALVTIAVAVLATGCDTSDRPRELSLDNVQPCNLVSGNTLSNLAVIAKPEPLSSVAGVDTKGASCYYSPRSSGEFNIAAITNQGTDRWTEGSMESFESINQRPVHGYPTIKVEQVNHSYGPHDDCELYVDVASGQSLRVDASENYEPDLPTCDIARRLAEDAVNSLGA